MAYERKAPQPPRAADANPSPGTTPDEMPPLTPDFIRMMSEGKSWQDRFEELLALEQGWYDGAGEPIRLETFLVVNRVLEEHDRKSWNLPEIVPTEDGCLYLEWKKGSRLAAAEVYVGTNPQGGEDILVDLFDWDQSDGREWESSGAGFIEVMTFLRSVMPSLNTD